MLMLLAVLPSRQSHMAGYSHNIELNPHPGGFAAKKQIPISKVEPSVTIFHEVPPRPKGFALFCVLFREEYDTVAVGSACVVTDAPAVGCFCEVLGVD